MKTVIQELLKKGNLLEAIDTASKSNGLKHLSDELLTIRASIETNERNHKLGLLTNQEIDVKRNIATQSLLGLLNSEAASIKSLDKTNLERSKFNYLQEGIVTKPKFLENTEKNFSLIASIPAGFQNIKPDVASHYSQIESISWAKNDNNNSTRNYELILTNNAFPKGAIIWKVDFNKSNVKYITCIDVSVPLKQVRLIDGDNIIAIEGNKKVSIWSPVDTINNWFGLEWIRKCEIEIEEEKEDIEILSYVLKENKWLCILARITDSPQKTMLFSCEDIRVSKKANLDRKLDWIDDIKLLESGVLAICHKTPTEKCVTIGDNTFYVNDVFTLKDSFDIIGVNYEGNRVHKINTFTGELDPKAIANVPLFSLLIPFFDIAVGSPHSRLFAIGDLRGGDIYVSEMAGNYEDNPHNQFFHIEEYGHRKGITNMKWSNEVDGYGVYYPYYKLRYLDDWEAVKERESWRGWYYRYLATSGRDGRIKIWHFEAKNKVIACFDDCHPTASSFEWMNLGHTNTFFAYADIYGFVHILKCIYDSKTPEKEQRKELVAEKERINKLKLKFFLVIVSIVVILYLLIKFLG